MKCLRRPEPHPAGAGRRGKGEEGQRGALTGAPAVSWAQPGQPEESGRAAGAAGGGFKASGTQGFKGPPGMGRASAGGGRSEEQAGLQKQQEPGACGRPVRRVEAQVAGKGILEVHLHLRMRKPLQAKRQARPGAG